MTDFDLTDDDSTDDETPIATLPDGGGGTVAVVDATPTDIDEDDPILGDYV